MTGWMKGLLVAGLLAGTVGTPATAQYRDAPGRDGPSRDGPGRDGPRRDGPQANRNSQHIDRRDVNSRRPNARQKVRYREVTVSHGRKWRKGQRLGPSNRRYVVSDWDRRGLRAPPRGYHWVRENNNTGDFLLVAVATGLIASILSQ